MAAPPPLRVLEPASRDYEMVLGLQRSLVELVAAGEVPDTLILVEHEAVVTVGRGNQAWEGGGRPVPEGVRAVAIERGGGVTYHGPGQLVGYPIVRLDDHDVRGFLRRLEAGLMAALAGYGLEGTTAIEGATGVWVRGGSLGPGARKVASIGIAVRKWVTLHGFALNVSTDLGAFAGLDPCGFDAGVMTSLSRELGRPVTVAEARRPVAEAVARALGFEARFEAPAP